MTPLTKKVRLPIMSDIQSTVMDPEINEKEYL